MKNSLLFLIISFIFISCSGINKQEIDFNKPQIQIPKIVNKPNTKRGSLYSRQGASLFSDKKDLQIGDIIQVVISESLSGDSNNKRELSSSRSTSLGGALASPLTGNTLSSSVQKYANTFNKNLGFGITSNSSNSFSGNTKSSLDESFSTTVSVIIQETYQNGNYYILGSKEMLIDGQKQEIKLSGVIRPYDISPENSISSSQIANLKILYVKDGEESDITDVPWGTKILNIIWPF